ncbi:alpha/beta hydrolase [Parvicella tangerina]|uniref:2-succinyl-6-hydroxy-2, 4-cyclohexadiene-1-carboxylate synthase n=1 Tax=Parvicella tangerina TaxID=2829795 RepID=A0A916NBW4_9FLAO|nr:alpha/beta hydrolase [Parvicella tangerina]CAG5083970.1 2-succinyl-6-hydroxy-2, 4-cyclohexadiene-1-carboxylate synthase [Parvicella tangerina]
MTNELIDSYNNYKYWRLFQDYFPEEFRIREGEEPIEEYWDWTDYHVHLDRYVPHENNRNIKLILVHGGGGNGRLLSPIGVAMRDQGFECVAADMPGFGLTQIGKPNSYDTWVDLVDALIQKETSRDGKKVLLIGISLGGMLSYHAACRSDQVVGLMVSSLADTTKKEVQIQLSKNKLLGTMAYSALKNLKSITDNIKVPIKATTKMWAMANDQSFVKLLKKDKVGSGSWVYLKFLRTLFEATPDIEPENFDKCPLLFFQPLEDHIIPWEISKPFYDRLACEKDVVFLDNCGHIPMEKPGIDQLRDAAVKFINEVDGSV